jgi:hypothetical protein
LQDLQSQLFSTADTNGDGSLSLDEFLTMMKNAKASAANALSADNSGTAPTSATDAFKSFDTNGDGQLSQAELTSGLDSVAKKFADAIAQYVGNGNGSSLVDLMFGTPASAGSAATRSESATAGAAATPAATLGSSSNDGDADDDATGSSGSKGASTLQQQREMEWYASAFTSQYNVNQQLAVAA